MRRNVIVVLFSLVSLMVTSCSKLDAFFNNGEPVNEYRNVSHPFTVIQMFNNVNVTLVHSSHPHLELNCPKNLIGKVTTEVSGDTLIVKNENEHNWIRSFDYSIDLTVYYDSLRSINYYSIGDLRSSDSIFGMMKQNSADTTATRSFTLRVLEGSGDIDLTFSCGVVKTVFRNGTSKVTLRGYANYAEHYQDSYGTIHAETMYANIVKVLSKSTNDTYVWPRITLYATLHSIGNVYYKGQPWIEQDCSNYGRVLPME